MAYLEIKNLTAAYHHVRVLRGVSIEVPKSGLVAVIGSNGAGKTTLLRAASGLVDAQGSILLDGQECNRMSPRERVRRGIIHCPEGRLLFPAMTVQQNLLMGAFLHQDHDAVEQDIQHVFHYFPILAERSKQVAGTLSGGEQQMVAVGRAIMGRPNILIMDEPSFGLAPLVVNTIFEVIQKLNEEGVTILLVEQNAALALRYSNYTYVLEEGVITKHGSSQELRNDDSVVRAYLGMT